MLDIEKKIKNLYLRATFAKRYGLHIFIAILIIIVFLLVINASKATVYFKGVKKNWVENRCLPHIIPIAGMINAPKNETAGEYTAKNFAICLDSIVNDVIIVALSPILLIYAGINMTIELTIEAMSLIMEALFELIAMITGMFSFNFALFSNIQATMEKILLLGHKSGWAFEQFISGITNFVGGVMTSIISVINLVLDALHDLIYVLIGIMLALWALGYAFSASFFLSWMAPYAFGFAAAATIVTIAYAIIMSIVYAWAHTAMQAAVSKPASYRASAQTPDVPDH